MRRVLALSFGALGLLLGPLPAAAKPVDLELVLRSMPPAASTRKKCGCSGKAHEIAALPVTHAAR